MITALCALYVWGDPKLDIIRPVEMDGATLIVRQTFAPTVEKVSSAVQPYLPHALRYIPDKIRYARFRDPMEEASFALSREEP